MVDTEGRVDRFKRKYATGYSLSKKAENVGSESKA
jgi:ribosomal protein L31